MLGYCRCRLNNGIEHEPWQCRDRYGIEPDESGRRKSVQIMPVDSSPTASPPHSASAEDLSDNKDLKRNGMRITFKARLIAARWLCSAILHPGPHFLSQDD